MMFYTDCYTYAFYKNFLSNNASGIWRRPQTGNEGAEEILIFWI